ncbi:hypothetical protein DUI87_17819 [Hirundo rustica rustica]|uniref:Uncharacterized protein n=1 Tax=Hirundo rustica rustica TaxID=333673 RepID=A0A3M0JWU4_HIRRU|nr:hypothetical protein DUI87_17819 [Hirundo rustica rustica]
MGLVMFPKERDLSFFKAISNLSSLPGALLQLLLDVTTPFHGFASWYFKRAQFAAWENWLGQREDRAGPLRTSFTIPDDLLWILPSKNISLHCLLEQPRGIRRLSQECGVMSTSQISIGIFPPFPASKRTEDFINKPQLQADWAESWNHGIFWVGRVHKDHESNPNNPTLSLRVLSKCSWSSANFGHMQIPWGAWSVLHHPLEEEPFPDIQPKPWNKTIFKIPSIPDHFMIPSLGKL